eukprot:Opistho-2@25853
MHRLRCNAVVCQPVGLNEPKDRLFGVILGRRRRCTLGLRLERRHLALESLNKLRLLLEFALDLALASIGTLGLLLRLLDLALERLELGTALGGLVLECLGLLVLLLDLGLELPDAAVLLLLDALCLLLGASLLLQLRLELTHLGLELGSSGLALALERRLELLELRLELLVLALKDSLGSVGLLESIALRCELQLELLHEHLVLAGLLNERLGVGHLLLKLLLDARKLVLGTAFSIRQRLLQRLGASSLLLQLIALELGGLAGTLGLLEGSTGLVQLACCRRRLLLEILHLGRELLAGGAGVLGLALCVLGSCLRLLELLDCLLLELVGIVHASVRLGKVELELLLLASEGRAGLALLLKLLLDFAEAVDKRLATLLRRLLAGRGLAVHLRLQGLDVDLETQLGILCALELVLKLLELRLLLLHELLERALGLLELVLALAGVVLVLNERL